MTETASTHLSETDLEIGPDREPAEPRRAAALPRPMEVLATAAAEFNAANGTAEIRAALLRGVARLSFGARCAVLEESSGGAPASILSRGLTGDEEEAVLRACGETDVRAALREGRLVVTGFAASPASAPQRLAAVPLDGLRKPSILAVALSSAWTLDVEESDALRAMAGLAGAALRADRARQESITRADRLRVLHEVGVAVSSELDLNSLYDVVHREIGRVLTVDAFYIALWDAEREVIHFPYSRDRGWREIPNESGLTDGPCSWVIRNRLPFVATEVERGVQDAGNAFGTGEVSRSALHVPMLLGDRVVGVMSTQSYEMEAYDEEDLHLFQMVAGQTAVAVENARLYLAVQDLSVTDELTGLPNRRAGMRCLEHELALTAARNGDIGILLLDLDRFKSVNDTHGHAVGDEVLREAASLLRGAVRQNDTVARWGGEEFLIVLPNTNMKGTRAVAESLRAAVEERRFADGRVRLPQTITIGGAALRGSAGASPTEALDFVDALLYQGKHTGRNRVIVHPWVADKDR